MRASIGSFIERTQRDLRVLLTVGLPIKESHHSDLHTVVLTIPPARSRASLSSGLLEETMHTPCATYGLTCSQLLKPRSTRTTMEHGASRGILRLTAHNSGLRFSTLSTLPWAWPDVAGVLALV